MTVRELSGLREMLVKTYNLPSHFDDPEHVVTIPESMGEGNFRSVSLRPGLELVIMDMNLKTDFDLELDYRYSHAELSFVFEGEFELNLGEQELQDSARGLGRFLLLKNRKVTWKVPGNQRVQLLKIQVDLDVWNEPFNEITWLDESDYVDVKLALQPYAHALRDHLERCPYSCGIKKLFLEGKVFELLAFCVSELQKTGTEPNLEVKMKPEDLEKIYLARDLLRERLLNPPSLLALSRMIGLNDFKLKAGFREVLKTTVFGFVRTERLHRAKELLESGSRNVSETASAVGYTNLSHFAQAFKQAYGINPKDYQKLLRNGSED